MASVPLWSPEHQSYIITTFELGGFDFAKLYGALKEKNFVIYPGKLTELPTFQLGCIGDIYPSDMAALVEHLKSICGALSTPGCVDYPITVA